MPRGISGFNPSIGRYGQRRKTKSGADYKAKHGDRSIGSIPRNVPPAIGLRRRYPAAPAGMRPNEINANFGGHIVDPSDVSRQAFIPNEGQLRDMRPDLMQRLRERRRSGNRYKAGGY